MLSDCVECIMDVVEDRKEDLNMLRGLINWLFSVMVFVNFLIFCRISNNLNIKMMCFRRRDEYVYDIEVSLKIKF